MFVGRRVWKEILAKLSPNHAAWKKVEDFAEERGLSLKYVSDKYYHRLESHRPMPHGGIVYAEGHVVCVRYERVTPAIVWEFIVGAFGTDEK
jgi:hypothetical protein